MSVPARAYLSIGEVLTKLRGDFPDITISKIRFLESEGLIDPQRTPSGYRKFTGQILSVYVTCFLLRGINTYRFELSKKI